MDIATSLRVLRKKNGFSQAQLAKIVDVKVSVISRWEQGTVNPNLEMAVKLAKALNVSLDVFCGISKGKVSDFENLAARAAKLPKDKIKVITAVILAFLK